MDENKSDAIVQISGNVSYLPSSEGPVSSDVVKIVLDGLTVFFDVGSSKKARAFINETEEKKIAVISHFHPDHSANLIANSFDQVYCGKNTAKYLKLLKSPVNIIEEKCEIAPGVLVSPIPSSHAKGSVCLSYDGICFIGDAAYPGYKPGKKYHNENHLRDLIAFLKNQECEKIFYSHEKNPIKSKEAVISVLENIKNTWRKENGLLLKNR